MTFQLHHTNLAGDTPGVSTKLYWYTAGPEDAETRVHLQAALHADELPQFLPAAELKPRQLVLGSIPVTRLAGLADLPFVAYVDVPKFIN